MYYALESDKIERPLDPAEMSMPIKGINDSIIMGAYYKVDRVNKRKSIEIDNVFQVIWKDSLKFIGVNKAGIKETFLYQSVFCGDLEVIGVNGFY